MKHWWQYDSDEERHAYIRSVRKLTEFSDKDTDLKVIAEYSPKGKIAYLKDEMDKLISEGIKKGGLVRGWIVDDKCKTYPDVEKVILKIWTQNKKAVEENWNQPTVSFNEQLFIFFRIYFPYVRLTRLLKEPRRQIGNGNLWSMVNDQLLGRFKSDLRKLDDNNFPEWGQGEFSAVCYYIYNAKQKSTFARFSSDHKATPYYIKENGVRFEAFKREMANCFNRKPPSHNHEKAKKELEKLTQEKKVLLEKLFT